MNGTNCGKGFPREGIAVAAAFVLAVLFVSFAPATHAAEAIVLMKLEHVENGERIQTDIELTAGPMLSPQQGKAQEKWTVRRGDVIKSATKPGEREVTLYKGAGVERLLLCTVRVRYFRENDGAWAPHYQLNEEPLVIRVGNRWQPVHEIKGAPNLIVRTGSSLPNAEGYFASLEFGLTNSRMQIDSWEVR